VRLAMTTDKLRMVKTIRTTEDDDVLRDALAAVRSHFYSCQSNAATANDMLNFILFGSLTSIGYRKRGVKFTADMREQLYIDLVTTAKLILTDADGDEIESILASDTRLPSEYAREPEMEDHAAEPEPKKKRKVK
jgi:hypothetical protein